MTHENQGGVEVLVVLLNIVCIIIGRLLLVHRIEIKAGVVILEGLEERSESISETRFARWSAIRVTRHVEHTSLDRFSAEGTLFRPFHHL